MNARYAAKAAEVNLVDAEWTRCRRLLGDECAGLENRYGLSVHRGFESPLSV